MLDRQLQRTLLERMAEVYPLSWDMEGVLGQVDELVLQANLAYLREHALIKLSSDIRKLGSVAYAMPTITARGMDFLADDGGLTAILGVVTIKIHDETVRAMLAAHIDALPGNDVEKSGLRAAVNSAMGVASKVVLERLVGMGINHLPATVEAMRIWIAAIL